jgi:D-glycero-D-manno-heptose 1,7-bisphosphate phosphatase
LSTPAIFLDRDGVLNMNRADHVKCWEEFHFLPGTLTAMRLLAAFALPIVVVTNQAIINQGKVSSRTIELIHARMSSRIRRTGGRVDRILYCPHTSDEHCDCRKPQPGLLVMAAHDLDIDLTRSVFVGDALTDVEAGQRAGCRTVLVRSGRGDDALSKLSQSVVRWPDSIAGDLFSAMPAIFGLLGLAESRNTTLAMEQQERRHEEFAGLQIAAHLSDAAFDS